MTDFGERRRVLPPTGQTISYRDGDDGYFEKGWNEAPRFKVIGDGTIIDNATGLMWGSDGFGPTGNNDHPVNWPDGIDYAIALDFAGHTGWRMPNVLEFMSVLDFAVSPLILYLIFDNAQRGDFWTSTTHPANSTKAFLWLSGLPAIFPDAKTFNNRLFCCRDA